MRTRAENDETSSHKALSNKYLKEVENIENDFNDLAKLAATATGLQTCLINLVDTDLQWTIGSFGSPLPQISVDESICQYTILRDSAFEVLDLSKDERFACMKRIRESGLRYYYGIPLRSAGGVKIGALCVLDRGQARLSPTHKEVLQLLAEQAEQRFEAISQMNKLRQQLSESERLKWTLAHDIRGPLTGITGLSELAGEEINDHKTAELPSYFGHIAKSGHSMLNLINDILAGKARAGENEGRPNDLNYLRGRIVRLFTPALLKKHLAFTFKIAPEAKAVPLPSADFFQAISNLVGNAIKFTPAGGQIAVEASTKQISAKDHLFLTITDTGIGMDEPARQRILSGNGTSSPGTAGENGSGLGLIMVRKVVEACYGTISIHSAPGRGTTFTIATPLLR